MSGPKCLKNLCDGYKKRDDPPQYKTQHKNPQNYRVGDIIKTQTGAEYVVGGLTVPNIKKPKLNKPRGFIKIKSKTKK